MIRTKTLLAGAAVTLLSLGALTGCSAGEGSDGPVTLKYWATQHASSLEGDEAVLAESLGRFTEETGIEVDVEVVPWADYLTRILSAVSSGEGPDVLNLGNTWTATLQDTGAFVPFGDAELEAVGGADRFIDSSFAAAGDIGLPLYSNVYALYYNPAMFAAAGIDAPPTTWDEFEEVGKKLSIDTDGDGSIDQWGAAIAGGAVTTGAHMAMIMGAQNGGSYVDEDGTPTADNDATVAAVDRYTGWIADGIVAPSSAELASTGEAAEQLISGSAAMVFQTAPKANFDSRGFTDWAVADMPTDPAGDALMSFAAGVNVAISEDSDHKDEALQLVEHLTSDAEQTYLNGAYGTLPVVDEVYGESAFQNDYYSVRYKILSDHSFASPIVSDAAVVETAVGTAVKDLITRAATDGDLTENVVRDRLTAADAEASN